MLHLGVVTLMPDIFSALKHGVTGRAINKELLKVDYWNPREWANNKYQQVDDTPYGGGAGMVMMYEPLKKAINTAKEAIPNGRTIYLSPQGRRIQQQDLQEIACKTQPLIFVAGRYEGIDERIIVNEIDEEWSLGDFVLSGGEIAAMAFIDAIARLLPNSLGHPASAMNDSFMEGLLDYPQYTKPALVGSNLEVPSVLLSGNHQKIQSWRRQQALGATWQKRPDLLAKLNLSKADEKLLAEFKQEQQSSNK